MGCLPATDQASTGPLVAEAPHAVADPISRIRHRSLFSAFYPDVTIGSRRTWRGLPTQFVLVTLAALLYFGARMLTKGAQTDAFANAHDLLAFERVLGLDFEAWAQHQILDTRWVVTLVNWVYIWLHWPVILGSLLILYRYNRGRYVLLRNALFVSGAIGLVFYIGFPVAPPRFLDTHGFQDTVTSFSTSYQVLQPPQIINKYAAMPSLHVGWNVIAGVVLYQALRSSPVGHLPVRFVPLLSPMLMTAAVVLTANHYVVDAVMGIVVAACGLFGAYYLRRKFVDDRLLLPAFKRSVA
jgi:hypothetical protein